MSRIGRMPITVPNNVTIDIADGSVHVKGPKGELERNVPRQISITREDGTLKVERGSDEPTQRSLHGLTRSLIANMVTGVTDGFSRRLEVNGVGYRAAVFGGNLVLQLQVWPEYFGRTSIGTILGTAQLLQGTSNAIGPLLLAALLDQTGSYRSLYLIVSALVLVGLTMHVLVGVPKRPERAAPAPVSSTL